MMALKHYHVVIVKLTEESTECYGFPSASLARAFATDLVKQFGSDVEISVETYTCH